MKKRFTEGQIVGFLREADAGLPVKDLCRRHGFSEASYYLWRSKFGGMSVMRPNAYAGSSRGPTDNRLQHPEQKVRPPVRPPSVTLREIC